LGEPEEQVPEMTLGGKPEHLAPPA
jgi:hypothetical protein